ncbi:MAG: hypothetical protein MRZ74_13120 [Blautia sp.]|nr:hypothetical protein [Blautia sp.]
MKERYARRKWSQVLLLAGMVLGLLVMTKTAYAASSVSPKYIDASWVKTGSGYAKRDVTNWTLYVKNSRGVQRKISSSAGTTVAIGDIVYYYECNSGGRINSYNLKTGVKRKICAPAKLHNFLGYYKGYVYYSVGEYYRETLKTYKQNVKTGKRIRIYSLNGAGDARQYKNYMAVMNVRGDPGPTTLRIYNLSTGKVVKTISCCTAVKIIKGMIYYSVYSRSGNTYIQKIYRCSLNGSNAKKLATIKGSNLMVGLERTCVYYVITSGRIMKYYYSSKKAVASSSSAYTKSRIRNVLY